MKDHAAEAMYEAHKMRRDALLEQIGQLAQRGLHDPKLSQANALHQIGQLVGEELGYNQ